MVGVNFNNSVNLNLQKEKTDKKSDNIDPQKKLDSAIGKLINYYSDKSDKDGDGRPDHYNPDFVDMLKNRNLGNGIGLNFKYEDLDGHNAEFRKHRELNLGAKIDKFFGKEFSSNVVVDKDYLESASTNQVAASIAHELVHANDYRQHSYNEAAENSWQEEYDAMKEHCEYLINNGDPKEIEQDEWASIYYKNGKRDPVSLFNDVADTYDDLENKTSKGHNPMFED